MNYTTKTHIITSILTTSTKNRIGYYHKHTMTLTEIDNIYYDCIIASHSTSSTQYITKCYYDPNYPTYLLYCLCKCCLYFFMMVNYFNRQLECFGFVAIFGSQYLGKEQTITQMSGYNEKTYSHTTKVYTSVSLFKLK